MKKYYLGIDIGSVTIAAAVLNEQNQIVYTSYIIHKGLIEESLQKIYDEIKNWGINGIGHTSSASSIIGKGKPIDTRIAYITAAKKFHPKLQTLLIIGAEKFGLVTFDETGEYLNFKSNSSCAAGTGNFLDQQAERLNLSSIEEFSKIAFKNKGSFPKIASRCAVFAKTDLIHAQQEGYTLGEICDGLSYGLAKNIVDAVFHNNNFFHVVAAGGVALNKAVIAHIGKLTGLEIIVDKYAHLYGAIGAAMNCDKNEKEIKNILKRPEDLFHLKKEIKKYYYPPLQLKLSEYPDFNLHETYEFTSTRFPLTKTIEVDVYSPPDNRNQCLVFLGIDVGSTSTKAVLLDTKNTIIAGFYTRTSGRPLQAIQVLFETITDFAKKRKINFTIMGAGTTGSGRKFAGQIIGADLILDEISAHARAAYELNPKTDTIIEIGGQDSKFTTMRNGLVTFSVMNNVCAAGTGSFIEEQAKKLGCSLFEYSERVENVWSPHVSDRCTVFMERDLNNYLMAGYTTDEILAAVLHSTRENYFSKVAMQAYIGNTIFFQGATAKNKALVAAFEQKLNKPIMVSRYCHLTGALGTAFEVKDLGKTTSRFKGLNLYKKTIPIRSEVCELCTNHCKLKIAEIDNEIEAYGFLCGRDYSEKKYIKNKTTPFQLIAKRKEIFRFKSSSSTKNLSIGIPAGLHLFEEILFWQIFFDLLSIKTVTSENYATASKDGKNLSGAEFCTPIAALHGHVEYLKDKADYIFLPIYLEDTSKGKTNKQYCYYTQFVSSVISTQKNSILRKKLLTPTLKSSQGELAIRVELYKMLKAIGEYQVGFISLSRAYEKAKNQVNQAKDKWKMLFEKHAKDSSDIHIMLLGRPYTVLSPTMNNNIPEIIERMGIETFYMDMLQDKKSEILKSEELIKTIKWKFASKILSAAEEVAKTDNCYPIFISSFKCTPDSFAIEYFKEILDAYKKPYLILQLDEHNSSVGYETRIEAGIRAFRNHRKQLESNIEKHGNTNITKISDGHPIQKSLAGAAWHDYIKSLVYEAKGILNSHSIDFKLFSGILQQVEIKEKHFSNSISKDVKSLKTKTLLLPDWDQIVGPLLEAVLQNSGVNARFVHNINESIQRSLSQNTGQCIPLNIIVQNAVDYIELNQLNPAETTLWIMESNLSCNLCMFPYFMKKLLVRYGKGMEQTSVFMGDLIFYDFSLDTAINTYLAYMFGGYIRKIGCSIRPYEKNKGLTDKTIQESLLLLYDVFVHGKPKEQVLERIIENFKSIEVEKEERPKVAIFGDLYVRDNDLINQDLIKTIEFYGGEVITTPFSEYIKTIARPMVERSFREGHYKRYIKMKFLTSLIPLVEDKYKKYFQNYTGEINYASSSEIDNWLHEFGLNILQRGESLENILKIQGLIRQYPDLDLLIQTNPSYCCPSLVTEAMASRIEELTGVPIVTIEYDGTMGMKNEDIIPYLKYRKKKKIIL